MTSHSKSKVLLAPLIAVVYVTLLALGLATPSASAVPMKVDSIFPADGAAGGLGGQFSAPRDVAVNRPSLPAQPQDGWVYVADSANNRIQAFDADGTFQFAAGRDVVSSGGVGNAANNEVQTVTLSGGTTGGSFTLRRGGSSTPSATIQWNDSPAAVQAALEGLSTIGAGSVSVSGSAGAWTIEFVGALADSDVVQLSAPVNNLTPSPQAIAVATQTPGANNAEVCSVEAQCKAGVAGALGGMFSNPQGIDIDQTTGSLYVRDTGNRRVQELTAAGGFVKGWGANVDAAAGTGFEVCTLPQSCQAGATSAAAGALATSSEIATGIAVVPAGLSNAGNVIVADPGNRRLLEFDPDALTAPGVFVRAWGYDVVPGAPAEFEICTAATTCQAALAPSFGDEAAPPGRFLTNRPDHVAIDGDGVVYASNRALRGFSSQLRRVDRFASTAGTAAALALPNMEPFDGGGNSIVALHALEVDPDADVLYQSNNVDGVSIKEYDLSQEPPVQVETHLAGSGLTPNGIGVNPGLSGGTLYVTSTSLSAQRVYVLDDDGNATPPIAVFDPDADPGTGVSDVTTNGATLSATVDPEGLPVTARFQVSSNGGDDWTDVGSEHDLGGGTDPLVVTEPVTSLDAATEYMVRLRVTRAFGYPSTFSAPLQFVTDAAGPEAVTLPPHHRSDTAVTLAGTVNPNTVQTNYYFEYGETTAYGARIPLGDRSVGAGGSPVEVNEFVDGLSPGTTYHYRLVAEASTGTSAFGDDAEFATRPHAASPPQRAYELVSPPEKISGVGVGRYFPGDLAAADVGFPSADGERFAVAGNWGAILLDGEFAYANDWAFAERVSDTEGWRSHSPFTHPNFGPAGSRFARINHASPDLSLLMWGSNTGHLKLFPEVEDYPDGVEVPMLGDWAGRFEVLAPTDPEQGNPGDFTNQGFPVVSEDGTHVLLTTRQAHPGALTGGGSDGFVGGLAGPGDPYRADTGEWIGGSAVYLADATEGVEDAFPGDPTDRVPVGTCDAGTRIPARVETSPGSGVFRQAAQECPAPAPLRDAALISTGGATTFGPGSASGGPTSAKNVISADGSSAFFMSPDPTDVRVDLASCSGLDASTSCPTQVYVRYQSPSGEVSTRWISRSQVPNQDASLMGRVLFEGATPDGDKVFFRTNSPLTVDDPNGACGAPCTSGSPSATSWDLYRYDFTGSATDDPGAGTLTRISRGPSGTADPNTRTDGSLRFLSRDGSRAYFTTAAPVSGALAGPAGGLTTPGGSSPATSNLYLFDESRPSGQQYRFVGLLPRDSTGIDSCATTAVGQGLALGVSQTPGVGITASAFDCVNGRTDGSLISFLTTGRLVAGDPAGAAADVYAYDAADHELSRVSAPQGSAVSAYPCVYGVAYPTGTPTTVGASCHGDGGYGTEAALPRVPLGLVTDPAEPSDRVVYFQSKGRLVAGDSDSEYDVYEWRNGELSLLSVGTSTGAFYTGNSTDGQDVFIATRDRLTWQDRDDVLDVYSARVGGGIPQPGGVSPCDPLAGGCQGGGAAPDGVARETASPGGGNASPGRRVRLSVAALSRAARQRAARTGTIRLRVNAGGPGTVRVAARARLGKRQRLVGRASRRVSEAGPVRVRVRLKRGARKRLRAGKALAIRVEVRLTGANARTIEIRLRGGRR